MFRSPHTDQNQITEQPTQRTRSETAGYFQWAAPPKTRQKKAIAPIPARLSRAIAGTSPQNRVKIQANPIATKPKSSNY